jgi:hypothetical protein
LRALSPNIQHTKVLPQTPADVQFEEDDDDGNKRRLDLQIKASAVPVLRPGVSSIPHPDPSVKALETLLSDLQLEESKPKSRGMFYSNFSVCGN